MGNYEFRFYRLDGEYSACCYYACVSDYSALRCVRVMLNPTLPSASIWLGSRYVGQVRLTAPLAAA